MAIYSKNSLWWWNWQGRQRGHWVSSQGWDSGVSWRARDVRRWSGQRQCTPPSRAFVLCRRLPAAWGSDFWTKIFNFWIDEKMRRWAWVFKSWKYAWVLFKLELLPVVTGGAGRWACPVALGGVHQCTSGAHQCTSVYISAHQCTSIHISVHKCTSVKK